MKHPDDISKIHFYVSWAWRLILLVALIVVLVYFVPLIETESVKSKPLDASWAYVLVLVAISVIVLIADHFAKPYRMFAIHWIMVLTWFVAFGIFGKMYLGRPDKKKYEVQGQDTAKMKIAPWVLLIVTGLWLGHAIFSTIKFVKWRKFKKIYGGDEVYAGA